MIFQNTLQHLGRGQGQLFQKKSFCLNTCQYGFISPHKSNLRSKSKTILKGIYTASNSSLSQLNELLGDKLTWLKAQESTDLSVCKKVNMPHEIQPDHIMPFTEYINGKNTDILSLFLKLLSLCAYWDDVQSSMHGNNLPAKVLMCSLRSASFPAAMVLIYYKYLREFAKWTYRNNFELMKLYRKPNL